MLASFNPEVKFNVISLPEATKLTQTSAAGASIQARDEYGFSATALVVVPL